VPGADRLETEIFDAVSELWQIWCINTKVGDMYSVAACLSAAVGKTLDTGDGRVAAMPSETGNMVCTAEYSEKAFQ